jgi:hypothetical protein
VGSSCRRASVVVALTPSPSSKVGLTGPRSVVIVAKCSEIGSKLKDHGRSDLLSSGWEVEYI